MVEDIVTDLKKTAAAVAGETVVGIVGLGDMGAAIAKSILRGGFKLLAFDLRRQAVENLVALGAHAADSLQTLAQQCDVVCVVVVNDEQVNSVVGELFHTPGRMHTVIVSSTVLPSTMVDLAEKGREFNRHLIDAPVAGGGEKAALGLITVLAGGEQADVEWCWPILGAFGKNLFHVGPVGAGSAGKLVNNVLSLGGNILQLEAMQLAVAYGISEDMATTFLAVSGGDSRGIRTWGRLERSRRGHTLSESGAIYEFCAKDVKSAAIAAGQRNISLPVTAGIGAMMVEKLKARDKAVEAAGLATPVPRCTICDHELAAPYRQAGVHPECTSLLD
jgi:3-hydroxyisobutyrate dehydrogenase-like beta-hydroxyacid dehydrogenase